MVNQPEQLGPYRIVRKLGRGGMGTVYEGINLKTDKPAAVKVLSAELGREPDFRQRFSSEIDALRKLRHPHIVRLFGFGEQEDLLFYVMELVDGTSLEDELQHGRQFTWRETTRIGIETCRALRHAHDRGVIHRDVKPANLLLTTDGQVRLSDFGIARLFGNTRITTAGSVMGTVEYMAPEQADGRPVDPRADLYSLGGVLYALLVGRPPFQARSVPEILRKQRSAPPDAVRQQVPSVPAELEAIIMQLLEREPEKRIPNAMLIARRLESLERALSVESQASDADAGKSDFRLGPSGLGEALPGIDDLPPTRVAEPEPEQSLLAGDPAPSSDDLPETRETSAFRSFGEPIDGDSESPDKSETGGWEESGNHFTEVHEDELDRIESEPSGHHALISLQTWILAVALIAVGLGVWYSLQPPSADALYAAIIAKTGDGTADSLYAAEDEIGEFLMRFPKDSRCARLLEYQREIDLYRLERKFHRRLKGLAGTEQLLPIERAYLEAIRYVRLDRERGMAKLQALIDLYNHRADISGPTGQCLELARRRLRQLRKLVDDQAADHLALLQDRLDRAEQLSRTDPPLARTMWKAMIELYDDKPWAAEAVERARAALAAGEKTPHQEQ